MSREVGRDYKPDRPHIMRLQTLHILWYMNHL